MGIIRRIRQWRITRRSLRRNHELAAVFATLEQLEKSNLLSFDQKNRRLFIEQPLAIIMLTGGVEKWQTFINNTFLWLYHRQCSEAWDKYILKEELAAVRVASKTFASMSRADIARVRRQRRDEITQTDMEPPKIEPFEFFIVKETTNEEAAKIIKSSPKKAIPAGTILAVGHYDPQSENLEMASWEEVKPFLETEGK